MSDDTQPQWDIAHMEAYQNACLTFERGIEKIERLLHPNSFGFGKTIDYCMEKAYLLMEKGSFATNLLSMFVLAKKIGTARTPLLYSYFFQVLKVNTGWHGKGHEAEFIKVCDECIEKLEIIKDKMRESVFAEYVNEIEQDKNSHDFQNNG
jgi:hypothetical protein